MDDDPSVKRLRGLADATRVELDAGARERVAQRVKQHGPSVLRRAKQVRTASRFGMMAAVIALGVVFARQKDAGPAPVAQAPVAQAPSAPKAAEPVVAPAPAPSLACRTRTELATLSAVEGAGGTQRLSLGAAGLVVADARTAMWLDAQDACRLRVRLSAGRVSVHAKDLGGGELRVTTPGGDVLVHGTTFAVAHDASGLTVDVEEGRVSVARAGREVASALTGGQRLQLAAGAEPVIAALPASARDALLQTLSDQTVDEADAPLGRATSARDAASAEQLVREATALWKRGEQEQARARFRQAGELRGATAEAAWLALARRELEVGRAQAAKVALAARAARFGEGDLAGEAAGIAFRIALQSGDAAQIRPLAERLQQRYADTPQGDAAARWLREHLSR
jgi:hypothetical protein